MYLEVLEILFIAVAAILTLLLIIRECGLTKHLSPVKLSHYISLIAGFLFAYIILAVALSFFISGSINKLMMLIFAISPFIIGKLVTYQKVKFYSIIQIVCVIFSLGYLFLI